jgi:hypothetical protein
VAEDEVYSAVRRSGLGRGARLALFAGVILLGVVLTVLRWYGVPDVQRGELFGPVITLMGVGLMVMELRRRR